MPPIEDRQSLFKDRLQFTEQEYDHAPYHSFIFPSSFKFAFGCSDGVESFYTPIKTPLKKYNQDIFCLDALRILLNIPSFKHGFAKRQRDWVFKQDKTGTFKRLNWLTKDDVSLAGIYKCPNQ
jgi:hypothetical protein